LLCTDGCWEHIEESDILVDLQEAADAHAAQLAEDVGQQAQRAADATGAMVEPGIDVDEFERPAPQKSS